MGVKPHTSGSWLDSEGLNTCAVRLLESNTHTPTWWKPMLEG